MRLAVLGGGQLGRMLALAGHVLAIRTTLLDPSADACAGQVAPLVVGAFDDEQALAALADGADAVTVEWENVGAGTLDRLTARGVPVHPPATALAEAQDRLSEKRLFAELGIPAAPFAPVDGPGDLPGAVAQVGTPALLKSRREGYDGRGQASVDAPADAAAALAAVGSVPSLLERRVAFDRELSVVAVRGRDGATACYPLVENRHRDGILRTTLAPAPDLRPGLQAAAETLAERLLERLDYVGVLAVELFETADGLLANEIAPRVHNSGHWTIEGAETSQFENHVRAVLGLPLGSTAARGPAAMLNLIGTVPDAERVLAVPGAHLHLYGKAPRPGRKLGHVTVVAPDRDALAERVEALRAAGLEA